MGKRRSQPCGQGRASQAENFARGPGPGHAAPVKLLKSNENGVILH